MLLALQSIYADSTAETTGEVNEKETADEKNHVHIGCRFRKGVQLMPWLCVGRMKEVRASGDRDEEVVGV